jgi:dihydroorotate dehydrogenase
VIYDTFKKVAFSMDAETIHHLSLKGLSIAPASAASILGLPKELDHRLKLKRFNIDFPFPVGLAAGLDKNAEAIDFFSRCPFGFIEVGTVTPKAQKGNPKPRLFRYPEEESLRNCMGFNNDGARAMVRQLRERKIHPERFTKPIGVNFGKNKDTPADLAYQDYVSLYKEMASYADYVVINISSPNTPGLRDLQATSGLTKILEELKKEREVYSVPLFVKLAPDLALEDIEELINVCAQFKVQGVVATNTSIMPERGNGGMSGKIISQKSRQVRQHVLKCLKNYPELHCIGVGGISHFDDLWDYWCDGGELAQIYTAFIYQGPQVLLDMVEKTLLAIELNACANLDELLSMISRAKKP